MTRTDGGDASDGEITFLFTDIEGSTKLWESRPEAMRQALARHDTILRSAIERHGGRVFKTVGDAFCAAFPLAPSALTGALEAHVALLNEDWAETPIRVRMGLHTGPAEERDGDYFGPTLNRVARLMSIGHGHQTLLSQATYERLGNAVPKEAELIDKGMHRLKDLSAPEHVWQLQHPALPQEFAPLKSLDYLPTNLPNQVTSFIGREPEMAEVVGLLERSRLVTLTGSGGTGKTRLALQVAADLLDEYPDGIWFIELAPLSDPDLVPLTVAEVLRVRESPGEPIVQSIVESLQDKKVLLLPDNCEHLLDAAAHLTEAILRRCPRVKVLASSRETLGIAGETAFRLPSLSVPNPKLAQTAHSVSQYDAVRLFIDRAVLARSDFSVTHHNATALASLCHRLDGIPLAVELAAARVRAMPVEQIETRLDASFRLLTGGSRTALPRQQTLRALIDWSYELLKPPERVLLQRLSVFRGGWRLESAEAVCIGGEIERWEVLDLLESLVGKSLVMYDETGGIARYRLLETVRQYGRDRLAEAGEAIALPRRHSEHFQALVEEAYPKLRGPDQAEWFRRLDEESENVRATLEWSVAQADSPAGLRLASRLTRYWQTRSHFSEGRAWFSRALAAHDPTSQTVERADALQGAGTLAMNVGDYEPAGVYLSEALAIRRQLGNDTDISGTLNNLGSLALFERDFLASRRYLDESLLISRNAGDDRNTFIALNCLGNVADVMGDFEAARDHQIESIAISRKLGEHRGTAIGLFTLGLSVMKLGDLAEAKARLRESLTILQQLGDPNGTANVLEAIAGLSLRSGDAEHAAVLWGAASALREAIGSPLPAGDLDEREQEVAQARQAIGDAPFAAAIARGRRMSESQATSFAME